MLSNRKQKVGSIQHQDISQFGINSGLVARALKRALLHVSWSGSGGTYYLHNGKFLHFTSLLSITVFDHRSDKISAA